MTTRPSPGAVTYVAVCIVGILTLCAIAIIGLHQIHTQRDACHRSGGVWVRGEGGHVCLDRKVLIQPAARGQAHIEGETP